jgi:hypothetical protein
MRLRMVAVVAMFVGVAILAPAALGQAPPPTPAARNPSDWCRPERGYFIDQQFVARPPTYTREQIMATMMAGENARAYQMMDANHRATQPIEMKFGAGTLRINPSNYNDQFYVPTTCAK